METSKEIIEQAKKRFKELKHKKYDEPSFFAGFLEAKALGMKKDFELKDFCEHLNTYKGLEEIRFDFMLVDFLDRNKKQN